MWTRAARLKLGTDPVPRGSKPTHLRSLLYNLTAYCHGFRGYRAEDRAEVAELRRRIRRLSPDARIPALEHAAKLREEASLPLRCVIDHLFPGERAWARADAEALFAGGTGAVPPFASLLLGSLDDPDLAARIVEGRLAPSRHYDIAEEAPEIVQGLGPRAVPVLARMFQVLNERRRPPRHVTAASRHELLDSYKDDRYKNARLGARGVLEALSMLRTSEAAAFFADHVSVPLARRAARAYLRKHPALAVAALAPVARRRNRAGLVARQMREALFAEHPELAPGASSKRRAARVSPGDPLPPEAMSEEIPPVLAEPPWRHDSPSQIPHGTVTPLDPSIPVDPEVLAAWVRSLPWVPEALVRSPRIAPMMSVALVRGIRRRQIAEAWLLTFPEIAAVGLLPVAVSAGDRRDDALRTLRFLLRRAPEAAARGIERYPKGAQDLLAEVLAQDPLLDCSHDGAQLPKFLRIEKLPRPLLAGRARALPLWAVRHLLEMLALWAPRFPYAGIAQVKQACDPASLDAFVGGVLDAWMAEGAPPGIGWPIAALGALGSDAMVRRLRALIDEWSAGRTKVRAKAAVSALAISGSDLAVTHLFFLAEGSRFPSIQREARAAVRALAKARGMSEESLAFSTVPDLDPRETVEIARARPGAAEPEVFVAGFDDHLEPVVRGPGGVKLDDLPRARRAPADPAEETWRARKADMAAVVAAQTRRLERAMVLPLHFGFDSFRRRILTNRVLARLLPRLVLITRNDAMDRLTLFRVDDEGAATDVRDEPASLDGAEWVGIPHPLMLEEAERSAWGTLLADEGLLQPFPQLGRAIYVLDAREAASSRIDRFAGRHVSLRRLGELASRGWEHEGRRRWVVGELWKDLPGGLRVSFSIDPGYEVGRPRGTRQRMGALVLDRGDQPARFGELDRVLMSEILRELAEVLD